MHERTQLLDCRHGITLIQCLLHGTFNQPKINQLAGELTATDISLLLCWQRSGYRPLSASSVVAHAQPRVLGLHPAIMGHDWACAASAATVRATAGAGTRTRTRGECWAESCAPKAAYIESALRVPSSNAESR